jgi:hypothetical protein
MAVMAAGENQVLVKAGPFGEGSGGHSHSDVLTLLARRGGRELLIDPGTYTYVADPQQRDQFRGSAAHNTIRIDGRDQALPAGPFRWDRKPHTALRRWDSSPTGDFLDAACSYAGFQHRRRVWFLKPDLVFVLDDVEGPPGEHGIEQFWHPDTPADAVRLSFATPAVTLEGWRSRAFASREAAPVLRVAYRGPLPAYFAAVLNLGEPLAAPPLECHREDDGIIVEWQGLPPVRVCFPAEGLPQVKGV